MSNVSQQDLADQLKLSRATVSRCFTNHPGINPETRAKVFELASRLGYNHMENRKSGDKKRKRSTSIGVLICADKADYENPDYENPAQGLIQGVSEYCQLANVEMTLRFVEPSDVEKDPQYADRLVREVGRKHDGALLLYPFPLGLLKDLEKRLPCVSLAEQPGDFHFDCVDVDHYQGIGLLIERLQALGHQRIGFYTKRYSVEAGWSMRRMGAFFEKMTLAGLRIWEDDCINAFPHQNVDLEASFDLAAERVKAGVTAFVCAADHQAYDLRNGLQNRGIQVPEDVSVTGFDGIRPRENVPPLTTVEIPSREIGYMASKRLVDSLAKPFGPSQHILLGCRLIEGDSVGKA